MNIKMRALFLMMLLIVPAATAIAQIETDPNLVYIPVSAADAQGHLVSGLRAEEFKVEEDKTPQQIVSLVGRNLPISVAVMLDVRGDLKDELKSAATSYFKPGASNPANQLFFVESGDKPLNEAVLQGLNSLVQRGTNPLRAFVLLTDRTTAGMHSFSRVKEVLKDQPVEFFAVGLSERQDILSDLAEMTGGQAFFPAWPNFVNGVLRTIALDLHNQYVIGYRPTNLVQDGKWRKVSVTAKLADPSGRPARALTIRAKSGYYAPALAANQPKK